MEDIISEDDKSSLETEVGIPIESHTPPKNNPESISSNPIHDLVYFRNKTLEQYPDLYYEYSNENFNYYGITDESLCPLCKLDHDMIMV